MPVALAIDIVEMRQRPELLSCVAQWQHAEWLRGRMQDDVDDAFEAAALQRRTEQLRLHLKSSRGIPTTWIALHKEQPVGSVSLVCLRSSMQEKTSVWMTNLFVIPSFRCRGVGSQLVASAEDEAAALRIQSLHLYTHDAINFYRQRGWSFMQFGQIEGDEVSIMVKPKQW